MARNKIRKLFIKPLTLIAPNPPEKHLTRAEHRMQTVAEGRLGHSRCHQCSTIAQVDYMASTLLTVTPSSSRISRHEESAWHAKMDLTMIGLNTIGLDTLHPVTGHSDQRCTLPMMVASLLKSERGPPSECFEVAQTNTVSVPALERGPISSRRPNAKTLLHEHRDQRHRDVQNIVVPAC